MAIFFLTSIQEKVFRAVEQEPYSVTDIARKSKLPRTSVAKALVALEKIQFVKSRKIREKNRRVYMRSSIEDIEGQIKHFESILFDTHHKKDTLPFSEESFVRVESGERAIYEALYNLVSYRKNERIYILQHKNTPKDFIELLGIDGVAAINTKASENGLILISVRGGDMDSYIESVPLLKQSYKNRITKTHTVADVFFEEKTSLYATRGSLLFVNLRDKTVIHLNDKALSSALIKFFELATHHISRKK